MCLKLLDALPSYEKWEKAKESYHRTVVCCQQHHDDYFKWYYSRMQQLLSDNSELFEMEVVVESNVDDD